MLALIFGLPFLAVNNGLVHPDLDTFVQRIYNLQQSNIHKNSQLRQLDQLVGRAGSADGQLREEAAGHLERMELNAALTDVFLDYIRGDLPEAIPAN